MSGIDNPQARGLNFSGLRHVALFGKKGSGKTSMFRSLVDSPTLKISGKGPHVGICNLGINGRVILIDTASLNSADELETEKMKNIYNTVRRADVAIYTVDIRNFDRKTYERDMAWLNRNLIPHLLVFNKCDISYVGDIAALKLEFPQALFLSAHAPDALALLRARIGSLLRQQREQEPPLIPKHLVQAGEFVVLVVPDNAYQAVRDPQSLMVEFLMRGVRCITCRESELAQTMKDIPHIGLVVAYARSFDKVRDIVPEHIPMTSYAFLFGRQKGDIHVFADGARALSTLTENSRVLIAEGCHDGSTHQDVGHVKIPRSLRKLVGENLRIDYCHGLDLPEDISQYDLVIHCGGCSLSRRTILARIGICREAGVPIANFGTILAEINGVLDRCMEHMDDPEK